MRSRGRMLVLISTVWAQRTKRALTRALIGGAQPVEGWWAPIAQHTYKRKRWGSGAHCPKFVALCPINRNPSRSGDVLKRREAPPAPATAPRHLRLRHATPPPLCTSMTTCHGGRRGHIESMSNLSIYILIDPIVLTYNTWFIKTKLLKV